MTPTWAVPGLLEKTVEQKYLVFIRAHFQFHRRT